MYSKSFGTRCWNMTEPGVADNPMVTSIHVWEEFLRVANPGMQKPPHFPQLLRPGPLGSTPSENATITPTRVGRHLQSQSRFEEKLNLQQYLFDHSLVSPPRSRSYRSSYRASGPGHVSPSCFTLRSLEAS